MRIIHIAGVAGLILLMVVFAGCQKPIPVHIKVTGMGASQIVPSKEPVPPAPPAESAEPGWAQNEIMATGYGAPPPNAVNRAQSRLMAKQAARRDALRNIAEQVVGVRINSKTTVRNFMTEDDEIGTRVEAFIQGAQVVSEEELDDGSWEVKMKLNLEPLADIITPETPPGPPPPPPPPTMGPLTSGQARLMAERAAKADAYRQLLEQLKGVAISSTTTVEDFMTKSDRIRSRVMGVVRGARVTDSRFHEDGTVEVDMVLDCPDIRQVIR